MKLLPKARKTAAAPVEKIAVPVAEPTAAPDTCDAPERAAPTGSGKSGVLTRIIWERVALLEMIGPDEELALAKAVAAERGTTIDAALRVRLDDLRGQHESAVFAQNAPRSERRDQKRAAEPLMRAAVEERFRLDQTVLDLRKRIGAFDSARRAFAERMSCMGLTAEEIAGIGLKPTHDELAGWHDQLAVAQARVAEIAAKLAGGAAAFLTEAA